MELQELIQFGKEVKGVSEWDTATIIRVGGALAAKVNGIKNLSGGEKLKLVLKLVRQLLDQEAIKELTVKDLTMDQLNEIRVRYEKLKVAVDDVLPASLELAINAARGKMDLKKIKPSLWVKFCSCFAGSVVSVLASQHLISESQAAQVNNVLHRVEEKAKEVAAAREAADAEDKPKAALEIRIPESAVPIVSEESKPAEDKKEENPESSSQEQEISQ